MECNYVYLCAFKGMPRYGDLPLGGPLKPGNHQNRHSQVLLREASWKPSHCTRLAVTTCDVRVGLWVSGEMRHHPETRRPLYRNLHGFSDAVRHALAGSGRLESLHNHLAT